MYRSNVKKKTGSIRVLSVSEESDVSSVGLSEGEYIVEKVVDVRLVKGKFEYKIRWEGYGAEDDTWEPENTLEREGVKLILAEFKESNAKKIQELQNPRAGNRNARKRAVKYEYVTVPVNSENETLTKFYGENVTREKKSLYDPNHKYTESEKLLSSLGHIQRISRHKMREMVGVSESAPSLANYTIPKKKKITEPVKRSKPSPIFPPIDDTPLVIDEAGSSSKHSSDARDFVDEIGLLDDYRREISPPASPPMEKVEDIPLPKENNNAKSCPLARESKSMENISLKKQPEHKTKPALLPPVRRFVVPELPSELSEEKDRKSSKNSPLRDDMHNRLINMPPRYFPREHYIRNGVRRPMALARNETRLPTRDEFIAIVKSMDSAKLIQIRNSFGHRQFTNLCTGSLDSLQLNILHWLPLEGGCRGEKHPADEIAWIIGNACGAALFRQVDVFGRAPLHYAVLHKKLCLVDIYIKLGSPINMRDKNGQTALMMAISQNQGRIAYLLLNAGGTFNDLYFADDHSECSRLVKSHEQRVELALQIDNGQAMLRDPLRVSPIFVTSLLDGPEFLFQFTLPDFPPLRSRDHTTVLVVCCIGKDGIKWTTQSYPRLRMMQVPYVSGSPVMDFPNTPMIYPCKVSAPLNDIYIRLAPETSRPHVMLACYICTGIYQYPHPVISR